MQSVWVQERILCQSTGRQSSTTTTTLNGARYALDSTPENNQVFFQHIFSCSAQTVCLRIPQEQYPRCHLYFDIRHCTTKNRPSSKEKKTSFAYAFLKLTDFKGTIQRDGDHVLHPCKVMKVEDPVFYLKGMKFISICLSFGRSVKRSTSISDPAKVIQRKGESLKIRTTLCSTQVSQHRMSSLLCRD